MKHCTLLLCLLALLPLQSYAASPQVIPSEKVTFVLEKVTDGLGIPWGMAFISDTRLLVTERGGSIKLLDTQSKRVARVQGAPAVMAEGQGGLLDVAVPPDFTAGDWIYFTFVRDKDDQGVTVLARAKLKSNKLVQWQDLLETRSATGTGRHFGSRIVFDGKGYVYFGVGDRGERPTAQNLGNHAGSVMRLYRDGRVPQDNPFIQRTDVQPEIWSYGHRNPQGMAYDDTRKRLWLIEHGPRGGDEINLVLPGRNYGWPVISYGKEYWGPLPVGLLTQTGSITTGTGSGITVPARWATGASTCWTSLAGDWALIYPNAFLRPAANTSLTMIRKRPTHRSLCLN